MVNKHGYETLGRREDDAGQHVKHGAQRWYEYFVDGRGERARLRFSTTPIL